MNKNFPIYLVLAVLVAALTVSACGDIEAALNDALGGDGESADFELLAQPTIDDFSPTNFVVTVQVGPTVGWVGIGSQFEGDSVSDYCTDTTTPFVDNGDDTFSRTCTSISTSGLFHLSFKLAAADATSSPWTDSVASWDNDQGATDGLYGYSNWDHTGNGFYSQRGGISDAGPADLDYIFP